MNEAVLVPVINFNILIMELKPFINNQGFNAGYSWLCILIKFIDRRCSEPNKEQRTMMLFSRSKFQKEKKRDAYKKVRF